MKKIARIASAVQVSSTMAVDVLAKQMKADGVDVASFAAGEPDFNTPAHIKAAAERAIAGNVTRYTPASGTMELKQAVCRRMREDCGLDYEPSQVVVTSGAKHCVYIALRALVDPGDEGERILRQAQADGVQITCILLTHGHFDHAGGIRFFDAGTIYLHESDFPCVENRQGAGILKRLRPLKDGHVFDLGGRRVRAIWLPGHSSGSMVFLDEDEGTLFAGDSLLCGPFFLLNGEKDIRSLIHGLTRLLRPEMNIRTFYPAHRELCPMTPDDVRSVLSLLNAILAGEVKGAPTWIAPMEASPYKTYHSGPFSVYAL